MGDMFRSEEMVLAQLFLQPEAAYHIISELGESGTVQFRDLNENVNVFQRKFVNEVRRCDELDRKIRYVETELHKDGVSIADVADLPKAPNPREIVDLEARLEKTASEIGELSAASVGLRASFLALTELQHVLAKAQPFFAGEVALPEEARAARGQLGHVAGVVGRERVPAFERMLWRITRGNVFFRQVEIEEALRDPASGDEMRKAVFVAFFQGEQLRSRVEKVCAGFHATLYTCPSSKQEVAEMRAGVATRVEDLNMVLNQTMDHRQRVLVGATKELQNWSVMVCKMKAIYHTLNFFNMDVSKKCLIGECWVAVNDVAKVQKALTDGSLECGSSIPSFLNIITTKEQPPTYNRTNRFTAGFQNLIDSYGVASYREANPALYTIITFPFLFAVMFGDVGHAIIMLAFGLYLVLDEKRLGALKRQSEIFTIFFAGRYIVLLMGIFSIYTGFIYNDIFSKSMNLFGSRWKANVAFSNLDEEWTLNPTDDYVGKPYIFGLDPVWQVATNKIIFLNSLKMKLSIIMGVTHMIFGVCVSIINLRYFKKTASIFLEFLPQLIFLCCLFLWMVIMMFMKWIMYSAEADVEYDRSAHCAPNVLIFFINMMLFKKTEPPNADVDDLGNTCKSYLFEQQDTLQKGLLFVALFCIPVILLGKPLYILMGRRRVARQLPVKSETNGGFEGDGVGAQSNGGDEKEKMGEQGVAEEVEEEEEEGEEPMSEIFIHQAIHTIEYILSTISHTASYLRLWALSLAHAQLSEVLWSMVFNKALTDSSRVGIARMFIIFAAWAVFTVAILVLMEGLSAFLHTLRLHWVEFMSKFYEGLGYAFEPFSFKDILALEESALPT